jgi:predicted flap endonuclease-1-like 5' DNA nuclease
MTFTLFPLAYSDLGLLLAVIGVYVFFAALWLVYVTTERTAKGSAETEQRIERLRNETISELATVRANRVESLTTQSDANLATLKSEISQLKAELATVREAALQSDQTANSAKASQAEMATTMKSHLLDYENHLEEFHAETEVESLEVQTSQVETVASVQDMAPEAPVVFKLFAPVDEVAAPAEEDDSANDPELGLVYYKRPAEPDDLTRIWGVGATNQDLLNENGVFYFHQVAKWDDKIVAKFNDILCFRGRIEREDWVGQAKRLTTNTTQSYRDAA